MFILTIVVFGIITTLFYGTIAIIAFPFRVFVFFAYSHSTRHKREFSQHIYEALQSLGSSMDNRKAFSMEQIISQMKSMFPVYIDLKEEVLETNVLNVLYAFSRGFHNANGKFYIDGESPRKRSELKWKDIFYME